MKKYIVLTLGVLMSVSSFADSRLVGSWCGLTEGRIQNTYVRTTDFTDLLVIDADGSLMKIHYGNETKHVYKYDRGTFDVAAGRVHLNIGGEDLSVYDYELKRNLWNQKMRLKIDFNDGHIERYQKCGKR